MDLTLFETLRAKLGLAHMGKPALIGLTALLVMVAVTAGRMIIDTATATEIALEPAETLIEESSASSSSEKSDGSEADTKQGTCFVHVSGAVRNAGLVEVSAGGRVADALEAAGGPTEDACVEAVNLARFVQDGEHIHLPTIEESESGVQAVESEALVNPQKAAPTGKVNINRASAEELEALPGIGPATAQKIVADRESAGPFETPEDLTRVSGIGEKKYASIADLICV